MFELYEAHPARVFRVEDAGLSVNPARRPTGPTCCGCGQGCGADHSPDPDGGGYDGLNTRRNHNDVGRAPKLVGCNAHNNDESG